MYNEKEIISKWNAEMYDLNETEDYDVQFALSVIGTQPRRILGIACGSGRFLVPMAEAGHDVTGYDFDEHMLNRITPKVTKAIKIQWSQKDVVHDEWESGFDVVLLTANLLSNIVSDMDYERAQELLIRKAAASLVPGGYVLIDYAHTFYPEQWFDNPDKHIIWQGTDCEGNYGKMMLLNSKYEKKTGMIKAVRRFEMALADGSNLVQEIPVRKHYATLEQVREWMERAGFVIENEWGDYCNNPISENTNRAIIWARKE